MSGFKVALVQPEILDGNLTPPLGLLHLGSALEAAGYDVKYFDQRLEHDIVPRITEWSPAVVGISAVTGSINNGYKIARGVKQALSGAHVVFGGPHPTAVPERTLAESRDIDFVIVAEGEYPFLELVGRLKRGDGDFENVANLYYRTGAHNEPGTVKSTPTAKFLLPEEIASLPMPAYHLLDIEKYFDPTQTYGLFVKSARSLPVMTSRGCPAACTFCCHVLGFRFRGPDMKLYIDEIARLADTYKLGEIHVVDDSFTFDRTRAMAFLDAYIGLGLGLPLKFANGLRADKMDDELLAKMKQAGVYTVAFGIESGSPRVLKLMRKNLSLDKVRSVVKSAREMGFLTSGNCIIGHPGETPADIEESIKYFEELGLDSMAIVAMIPFPGTVVWDICEKNGYFTEAARDWDKYIFEMNNPVPLISTPELPAEELRRIVQRIYRRIYLNPRRLMRIVSNVSVGQMYRGAKIMLRGLLGG